MAVLEAAYAKVEKAEDQAAAIIHAARLDLGRAIRAERAKGTKQAAIAKHFGVERETIRRIQEAADIADGLKPAKD
jgi:hypothetical protein